MIALSIVSPVHCEEAGIAAFLDEVERHVAPLGLSFEIILVDDGSTDASWRRITEEAAARSFVRGVRLSRNFGKEAALVAGIDASRGQAVITLDSDLQHPPSMIPEMARIWRSGEADVVEARKEKRQSESFSSALFARVFYSLFSRLTPFDLEGASDFKLMDRRAVEAWKRLGERRVFFRGMSSWLGFQRVSLPFTPPDRGSGSSSWSFVSKCILAVDSLSAYTASPLSLIWVLGLFFVLFATVVGGEALWAKFNGEALTGFTTVILLILITGASLLAAVCLLSLYIRQIFHEVKGRPRYLTSEEVGPSSAHGRWNRGGIFTLSSQRRRTARVARRKGGGGDGLKTRSFRAAPGLHTRRHARKALRCYM